MIDFHRLRLTLINIFDIHFPQLNTEYRNSIVNTILKRVRDMEKEEKSLGEWIKVKEERMSIDMSGEIATRYKCSKCGRTITILPSKLVDYPFCHCGADMRKGGAENE